MSQHVIVPKHYIELNSTYRNRNMWPNQARFDIPIMNAGQRDFVEDAMDPISNQDSVYFWQGRDPESDPSFGITGGVPSAPIIQTPPNRSAYRGQFLGYSALNDFDVPYEMSLITFYSAFSQQVFLETPLSGEWEPSVNPVGRLIDLSDGTKGTILMTHRGLTFDGQFVDNYLIDMTIMESRKITNYSQKFAMLTLESPFTNVWNKTDEYIIVKELPPTMGSFQNQNRDENLITPLDGTSPFNYGFNAMVFETTGTVVPNVNVQLLNDGEYFQINSTNTFNTRPFNVSGSDSNGIISIYIQHTSGGSWDIYGMLMDSNNLTVPDFNNIYGIRIQSVGTTSWIVNNMVAFYESGFGVIGSNKIRIDDLDKSINYVGKYIKLIQFTGPDIPDNSTSYITGYDSTTNTLTLSESLSTTYNTSDSINYLIMEFDRDIASYLSSAINDSITAKLYKISLNNLILPNVVIGNSIGGTTSNYPYVYVTFANKSIETKSLINSNNPNSYRATFRCPIEDVENPEYATFVKIRSEMISTFYYNPKDEIVFEVRLPNGQIFTTLEEDTKSPLPPDPMLQISCVISLEEIVKEKEFVLYQNYY